MNTNSKKLVGAILFPLLFITHLVANSEIKKYLEPKATYESLIKFSKGDYVVGEYSLTNEIKSLDLLDSKGDLIRKLNPDNYLKDEFYFVVEDDTNLRFKITNLDKQNNIYIKINKIIPIEKQGLKETKFLSKKIQEVYEDIKKGETTKEFWKFIENQGTPLVEKISDEKYVLTYLYKGAKNSVKILGAPISKHVSMKRLENSDIWYKSFIVPKGTILSYQLAPDIPTFEGTLWEKKVAILSTLQVDPLNKHPLDRTKNFDKYNKVSTIIFDDNKYKYWTYKSSNNYFKENQYTLESKILNNKRKVAIYKPKDFDKKKVYPLLVFFDGDSYQNSIDSISILNNLISENKLPKVVAVFVDNPSSKLRAQELPCNIDFANFMSKELYPFVKKSLDTNFEAKNTVLIGSSFGGLASSFISYNHPNIFGKVLSLSGSYWWKDKKTNEDQWLTKQFMKSKKLPIEFFLAAGKFEIGDNDSTSDILSTNRNLRDILITKGYKVSYEEFPSGHDSLAWEYLLPYGLIKLF